MKKTIIYLLATILLLAVALATTLRLRYGGGGEYPDITTDPLLGRMNLEVVFMSDEPLGNVAVSKDNRVFYTIHPESRPEGPKVLEVVGGQGVPYPNEAMQASMFNTVLGLFIDEYDRLWVLDHGNHGLGEARLTAFDLATGEVAHTHVFPPEIAELGSFFNDLQVSPDGVVYIADVSFFAKNPAIVIYDIASGTSRRLLEGHESVIPQDWIIRNPAKDMVYFWGLVALKPGIDGIVLDKDGKYLYYGAMAHNALYRINTDALGNAALSGAALATHVERVGTKPLSDGLSIDTLDNIYITDVEHGGISVMAPDGQLMTLVKDPALVRWADGCSFGGDGYLYFTDSALPDQMMQSKKHMREKAPYFIYKINTGIGGIPGR